jgi:hypothetical protein
MYTDDKNNQYKIEYTDLFGNVYYSGCKVYTREFARSIVRMIRTDKNYPMFDKGRRACLKNIRCVKSN